MSCPIRNARMVYQKSKVYERIIRAWIFASMIVFFGGSGLCMLMGLNKTETGSVILLLFSVATLAVAHIGEGEIRRVERRTNGTR